MQDDPQVKSGGSGINSREIIRLARATEFDPRASGVLKVLAVFEADRIERDAERGNAYDDRWHHSRQPIKALKDALHAAEDPQEAMAITRQLRSSEAAATRERQRIERDERRAHAGRMRSIHRIRRAHRHLLTLRTQTRRAHAPVHSPRRCTSSGRPRGRSTTRSASRAGPSDPACPGERGDAEGEGEHHHRCLAGRRRGR